MNRNYNISLSAVVDDSRGARHCQENEVERLEVTFGEPEEGGIVESYEAGIPAEEFQK